MFRFGHEYLFWSAGYYNVMELVGHFDIVLLVPCTYRMSNRFLAFLEENPCVYCVYSPELNGQSICSHQRFFRHSKDVIKDHKPDILVQNDYFKIEQVDNF